MADLLPYLIGGLANGALYSLLALGFVLVYRATSVVNFAIGEFLLVGAYLTYTFALLLPLPLALLAALPLAFLFGVLVERGFVRPLLGRNVVAVIMATIGLAADEIVMDENAVLGPVDPQLGQYPAASIVKVLEKKPLSEIDDQTLILADVAEKALRQVKTTVKNLLKKHMPEEKAEEVATLLSQGTWTHDYPIDVEQARSLGLPVSTEMPIEVYELMELYPQAQGQRPSVQYVPLPYRQGPPR